MKNEVVVQKAFVLRIAPSEIDQVSEALKSNELIIGWSTARGLLNPDLDWIKFRQIVHDCYYSADKDYRKSSRGAGSLWAFIREMNEGSLVVVPHGAVFYIARVTGDAYFDETKIEDETAYRRPVEWLNNKNPIPRQYARAALQSRMKAFHTCIYANDLIPEIQEVLEIATKKEKPLFQTDLRKKLIQETQKEICSGRLESYSFENLIASLLKAIGSTDVRFVPRNIDKGVDILADCSLANVFKFTIGIQARHHQPQPPIRPEAIDYFVSGLEAENLNFGLFVTSGSFSEEAIKKKEEIEDSKGLRIELIDGEQLASLIIETGLRFIMSQKG